MLSNVVRIIQKIAPTTTLTLGLSTLKFWFYFPTSTPPSHSPRTDLQNVFYEKDAYGKYLSYATLAYVPCLGAEVFKFP